MEGPHRLKIGVTGASGFVGRFAIAYTRTPDIPVAGCVQTRYFGPPRKTPGSREIRISAAGVDAIVHLAGEPIFGFWTDKKKEKIFESRREGTRALVDAIIEAGEAGPKVLVSASAIGYYGDTGDREVDESAPPGTGFLAEVAQSWEAEALRAEQAGVRVPILRIGLVLGREGGAMSFLRRLFRCGLGVKLGHGQQWVSWIHVSDLARLVLFSIENSHVRGPLNATAPNPVRNVEFTEALARKFNRRAWFTAPANLVKWIAGDFASALLDSQRVLPRRTETVGYHCQYKKL